MKYLDNEPYAIRANLLEDYAKVQKGLLRADDFIDEIVATLEVYRTRTPVTFPCTHCYRVFYSQRGLDIHKEKVRSQK